MPRLFNLRQYYVDGTAQEVGKKSNSQKDVKTNSSFPFVNRDSWTRRHMRNWRTKAVNPVTADLRLVCVTTPTTVDDVRQTQICTGPVFFEPSAIRTLRCPSLTLDGWKW